MHKIVAITIGDPKGIGIHILINTWKKNKNKNFILFTDLKFINKIIEKYNLKNKINIVNSDNKFSYHKNKFNIYKYKCGSSIENTIESLKLAYKFCKKKICIGIITLPLRKDLVRKLDKNFLGQTEFFQKINNKKISNMILYHKKIIVSPITTHIEIKKISKNVSDTKYLYNKIYSLYKCLEVDFNINNPKVAISGLNPHSGENGEIGIEEIKYITPTIKKLRNKNIYVDGPISADSILIEKNFKKYDCFVFMYHDQALIPFKFISQFSGVNYTGNLDIIRTSPDHGTGYDLIGTNNISNKSFLNCFNLIIKIHTNRIMNDKS